MFDLLQLTNVTDTTNFTTATIPSKKTVEQYIEAAQSKIDFRTRKSWRPNYITDEYHDFNLNGKNERMKDLEKAIYFMEQNYRGYEKYSSDTSSVFTSIKNEYNKLRDNDPNFQYYGKNKLCI